MELRAFQENRSLLICFANDSLFNLISQSKIIKLKVFKKPDKRDEELLVSDSKDSDEGGLWNSITSTLAGIDFKTGN